MSRLIKTTKKQGFTLVEMSIVIIIIGLLIAGVAAGTSLIEQARLNSVIVDFRNNQVAYYTFVSKYNAVPGDMPNASQFWPNTCTTDNDPLYCNGDGNGLILGFGPGGGEERLAWKHLSLAGFASQGFALIPDDGFTNFSQSFGRSKVDGAYYVYQAAAGIMAATWPDKLDQNLLLIVKGTAGGGPGTIPTLGSLTPSEAFSIDNKMDDATSSGGNMIGANTGLVRSQDDGTSAASPCVNAVNANQYNVSGTLQTCIFSQILTN